MLSTAKRSDTSCSCPSAFCDVPPAALSSHVIHFITQQGFVKKSSDEFSIEHAKHGGVC
jgi:hypothetical protein